MPEARRVAAKAGGRDLYRQFYLLSLSTFINPAKIHLYHFPVCCRTFANVPLGGCSPSAVGSFPLTSSARKLRVHSRFSVLGRKQDSFVHFR